MWNALEKARQAAVQAAANASKAFSDLDADGTAGSSEARSTRRIPGVVGRVALVTTVQESRAQEASNASSTSDPGADASAPSTSSAFPSASRATCIFSVRWLGCQTGFDGLCIRLEVKRSIHRPHGLACRRKRHRRKSDLDGEHVFAGVVSPGATKAQAPYLPCRRVREAAAHEQDSLDCTSH
jgi:hypothetical protein